MDIGPSEAETFWTDFLRKLARRGLRGVKLVVSDAHEGLKAAVAKVLNATWQRCRVGLLKKSRLVDFRPDRWSGRSLGQADAGAARSGGSRSCSSAGSLRAAGSRRPCSGPRRSGARPVLAALGGGRALLRRQRPAGHRPRGRGAADARRLPARHRPRPAADAGGAGQSRHPLVRRLRPARGPARPFVADAHPPALGCRAVPPHLRAHREGLHRREDRQGRDRPYRRLADPRRCELGEPGRPPRRGRRRENGEA